MRAGLFSGVGLHEGRSVISSGSSRGQVCYQEWVFMRAGLFSGVGGSGFSRGQISQEWVVVGLMRAGL